MHSIKYFKEDLAQLALLLHSLISSGWNIILAFCVKAIISSVLTLLEQDFFEASHLVLGMRSDLKAICRVLG